MVERIEDLNLPNAVVARLIKDALPEGANVSKESRAAIAKAASVFVIFLTSTSTSLARKQNHKTISSANILESLKQLEFESFVEPLEKELEAYRKQMKDKKEIKAQKDANANANAATTSSNATTGSPSKSASKETNASEAVEE